MQGWSWLPHCALRAKPLNMKWKMRELQTVTCNGMKLTDSLCNQGTQGKIHQLRKVFSWGWLRSLSWWGVFFGQKTHFVAKKFRKLFGIILSVVWVEENSRGGRQIAEVDRLIVQLCNWGTRTLCNCAISRELQQKPLLQLSPPNNALWC